MTLPVVLQTVGLVGLAGAALVLWGAGVALLVASLALVVAGTVLERERG